MKDSPILFSAPMVRAILAGTKSQTRRIVNPQPSDGWSPYSWGEVHKMENGAFVMRNTAPVVLGSGPSNAEGDEAHVCRFVKGSRLWVRETFKVNEPPSGWIYRATDSCPHDARPWKPSIFMPRAASRITLEILSVRVERAQDISEEDAIAEGVEPMSHGFRDYLSRDIQFGDARASFMSLWSSINGAESLVSNPFVWAITFRRI